MSFLDMRSVVFSVFITGVLCAVVMALLWRRTRTRYAGTGLWAIGFALHGAGTLIIGLRGSIPDWLSIVLANTVGIAGILAAYVGLERFVGRPSMQIHNIALLAVFAAVHAYFTFAQPSLAARTLNLATGLFVLSGQCAWLLWRRVPPSLRPVTRWVGLVFGTVCLVNLVRIITTLVRPHAELDFFRSGPVDVLYVLAYQALLILLAYSLTLMVNDRLLLDIQGQEEKFAKAFRSASHALAFSRVADGRILDVNEAFERITGYSRADVLGKSALDLGLWIRAESRAELARDILQGTRIHEREYAFRTKAGDILIGSLSSELLVIEGEPWMFSSIADITLHKRSGEALRTRTTQLEAIRAISTEITRELDLERLLTLILHRAAALVQAPAGIISLWDEEAGCLTPWSRFGDAFAAMPPSPMALGEGVMGRVAAHRQGLIVNDYRAWPHARPETLAKTRVTAVLAEPLLYRDRLVGVLNVVHVAGSGTFSDADQTLLRLFADHAAIAVENARLYGELRSSLEKVQQAQVELVRSAQLRGLGQMAAGIAHELNNVLTIVLGQVEIGKHATPPPTLAALLERIETAAADGAATVRRLQDFARPKGTRPLGPCDLAAIAREAVELAAPRWKDAPQRRGVTITVEVAMDDLPPIQGYAPEIREALTNLLFNAADALPHGGRITLRGAATDHTVTLTVADTGIGMSPEVQAKIFEPFFTTKGVQGTGLGLAVVYGILERHGGSISVTSAPMQGTAFTLTFQQSATGGSSPCVSPTQAPAPQAPRRLLVVDDEPGVRETLTELLRVAGHTVLEAPDGPSALSLLDASPIDCVLTDLGMPDMSGWDLARRIKATIPVLPVILLTGWQERAPGDAVDRQHVDAILGKPVRLPDLLQAIARVTAGHPAPSAPPFQP